MLEHVQNMSQVFQKPKITKQKNQVAPKVTPSLGETKNAETIMLFHKFSIFHKNS